MSQTSPAQLEQVLIVSSYPIFAQALERLVREAGYQVMASVAKLDQALNILQPNMSATVIVDCQDIQPRQEEWLPLLQQANATRRIILLSLNRNEMIVHEQRRVTQVNEDDLKQALAGLNAHNCHFEQSEESPSRQFRISRRIASAKPRRKRSSK
ncbi:MAG: hypothetical protein HZB51_10350 [Chloroflexi bacterium]|nr:hypothetical protein [Chloroflexota bacterium]